MDKAEFVKRIKAYIVDLNNEAINSNLNAKNVEGSNVDYLRMIQLFQRMNADDKLIIQNFMKLVINNSVGSFLAVIDGISDIGQDGEFKLYYTTDNDSILLNEQKGFYLSDYFWGDDSK